MKNKTGNIISILSSGEDISECEKLEINLKASQKKLEIEYRKLEDVYRTVPLGLGLIDKDLRYVYVNEDLARINGKSVEEHYGKSVDEIIPSIAEKIKEAKYDLIFVDLVLPILKR